MKSSFVRAALPLLALCAAGPVARLAADPIIREPGAIYLSDFEAKPMKLKLLQPAPAYFDFAGSRYVGTLRAPQLVEVQAIADQAYRVRGNAQQGQVLGWVDPKYLQPIAPEVLTALRKSEERRKTVAALIAANQLAIGMTPTEVELSIGKPQKRSSSESKEKSPEQVWDYVKYATIPQNTTVAGPGGAVSVVTTYVKTPVGRLTVTFKEGVVQSLDQSEGTILSGNQTTIVAPPILLYW
ncbi:MAG: hypothetical protein PHC88_13650 [Terrimicrobiaceae bacterium]|nr:hypothetical protein [Terrimicrobiaceae bacterium]